jgi:cyclopropane-fatty-acyl-phospholipid synthase
MDDAHLAPSNPSSEGRARPLRIPGPGPDVSSSAAVLRSVRGDADPAVPAPHGSGPAIAGAAAPLTVTAQLARRVLAGMGRRIAWGSVVLEDEYGTVRLGDGDPRAHVRVHHPGTYGALLRQGSVGFGRSYVDGWWDSDDLTDLVRILVHNRGPAGRARDRAGQFTSVVTDPVRRLRRRPPAADRRDVRAHYDIGNELFSLMLDSTLSYSCAVFEQPTMTLEAASLAKLDRICRKLDLSPADHVVEIGTGWGGFAVHAATRYGCRVTSTTISAEQYAHASEWVARLGLSERVTILQEDYRNLCGRYDKLVSIEMVEAVDWRLLDTYFRRCAALLRPDGLMALQAITIADQSYERAKASQDFIKAFIFPGGCLPSVASLARSAARTDLRIVDLEDIGRHYAETLRRWRDNVDQHRGEIEDLGFDDRFLRMWRLYLCYCEAAFLERHISDVQLVLAKPAWRAPLLLRT